MDSQKQDFEIVFFEGLVKKSPNYVEALISLAEAYTRNGRYKEGLRIDRRLSKLCGKDPVIHYNLACSLALVEDKEKAFKTLTRAVELGYSDFDHMKQDSDLKNLHGDPRFKKLLKRKI